MSQNIDVVISSGCGRLHMIESATALSASGIKVRLILGWVPANPDGFFVMLLSKIVRSNLASGLRKRVSVSKVVDVKSCALPEFLEQIGNKLLRNFPTMHDLMEMFVWKLFGWQSHFHILGAKVFHVRSGAGQGGAIRFAKRMGIKVVVDHSIAHCSFMERVLRKEYESHGVIFPFGSDSKFWAMVDQDCRMADVILVNSDFVKRTFVDAGYDPNLIRVVYLGVREDFIGLRTKKCSGLLRLLFTGYYNFRKGSRVLCDVIEELHNRRVNFRFDAYGSYDIDDLCVSTLSRIPGVSFHGPVPQDDLKAALSDSDIYVFPSFAEGCAKSAQEAMAAGLCCIVTEETGIPVHDGETGFLVPLGDVSAIVDMIIYLNQNREVVDRVGANAMKYVKNNCTLGKYAENLKRVYSEV